jgi:hypothetical protein
MSLVKNLLYLSAAAYIFGSAAVLGSESAGDEGARLSGVPAEVLQAISLF